MGVVTKNYVDRGADHLRYSPRFGQLCERCWPRQKAPFTRKQDSAEWIKHKMTDETWQQWRDENPDQVAAYKSSVTAADRT